MQFASLEPFPEGRPIVELHADGVSYDLHNDAIFESLEVQFERQTVQLFWKAKTAAWMAPSTPEPHQRKTQAGLSLTLSSVRAVRLSGEIVFPPAAPPLGLEFIEYHRLSSGIGELRIVFENETEVAIRAGRCELALRASQ